MRRKARQSWARVGVQGVPMWPQDGSWPCRWGLSPWALSWVAPGKRGLGLESSGGVEGVPEKRGGDACCVLSYLGHGWHSPEQLFPACSSPAPSPHTRGPPSPRPQPRDYTTATSNPAAPPAPAWAQTHARSGPETSRSLTRGSAAPVTARGTGLGEPHSAPMVGGQGQGGRDAQAEPHSRGGRGGPLQGRDHRGHSCRHS